jgi:transposase
MQLTPEQKAAVASWVTAGDNLSVVQRKLTEQFKLSLTYRDVRFLVDDLELTLKDPAPKVDTSDLTKATVPPPSATAGAPRQSGAERRVSSRRRRRSLA